MAGNNSILLINIWSILLLFGALHGYFLAAVFYKKGWYKSMSNHFFASFLVAISYILTNQFIHEARLMQYVPHLLATSTPVLYLLGPLFYFYFLSLFDQKFVFKWSSLLHFFPFIICVMTIIPFYLNTAEFKIDYIQQSNSGPVNLPYTRAFYYGLALIQNGFYWWLCSKLIYTKREKIKPFIERWLSRSIFVYAIFLITYSIVFCLFLFTDFYLREVRFSGYLLLSFTVHLYGYLLLQESRLIEKIQSAEKYMSSGLKQETTSSLKEKVLNLFSNEKPYLKSDLKLEDVAEQLDISPHYLSQIINTEFNSNFNNFINSYRVKEAQKMLQSDQYDSYSLEGIAMEAGFNNRTSFYRVFRKHTGTTPTEFKNSALES